jgi:hypothetical protein
VNLDMFSELDALFGGPPAAPAAAPTPAPAPAPAPVAAPVAAPKPKPAAPPAIEYLMQPCGTNRWSYKSQIIAYDSRKETVAGRGRWSCIEGIGKPEVRGHSHREICAAIDARSQS